MMGIVDRELGMGDVVWRMVWVFVWNRRSISVV